jgi:hypothetical protein
VEETLKNDCISGDGLAEMAKKKDRRENTKNKSKRQVVAGKYRFTL